MFPRFIRAPCHLTFNTSKYFYHKNMANVYMRCLEPSERFDVTFSYEDNNFNICRTFNLKRNVNETAHDFTCRIKTNVEKMVSKKFKRKKGLSGVLGTDPDVDVDLMHNNNSIDSSKTCKEVLFSGNENLTLKINKHVYNILINPPWVESMSIPQSLMSGSYAHLSKFEIIFGSKSQSKFIWFISNEAGGNWKEVSSGEMLYLTDEFLGRKIKLVCIPGNGSVEGPEVEVESNAVIRQGPTDLPFLLRHQRTTEKLPFGSFRVVSYNILADVYAETEAAKTELFPYCPPFARNIDYRKQLIIKELLGYNADIICLQECDARLFKNDLTHALSDFEGVLTRKSGTVAEGIATFYRKRKFRLLDTKILAFADEIDKNPLFSNVWDKIKNCESLKNSFKERTTVFHALVLESSEPENTLVVGNTHLFFHPDADHVRLIQGGMATMFMEDIINHLQKTGKNTTLVFCGDMNSTPDCGLYLLMTEKKASADLKDWQSDPKEIVKGLEFSQPFEMRSAYGAPPFTNYTEKFYGCLDYIYFQSDVLKLLQTVPIPEESVLKTHTALPSPLFPSDHISLVADFAWNKS